MTYEEGVEYMTNLCKELKTKGGEAGSFDVGELRISYPGYKSHGDYRLSLNGRAVRHDQVVARLYEKTTSVNADELINALEDLYVYGLRSENQNLSQKVKEFIYWITLQEDINYPPTSGGYGKKLAYQRFYEAILAKLGYLTLDEVIKRTNNHGLRRPSPLLIENREHPRFYR